MLHITFKTARDAGACTEGYRKLANALGGIAKYGKDTPISLLQVLEHNGLADTLWALRCVLPEETKARDKLARLFACDCAEQVLCHFENKYPDDKRPRTAIEVARKFANGQATQEELDAAEAAAEAARAAARAAAGAARAAWNAAEAAWAAEAAAWAAARAAAWAAEAAAWAAARAAAWAAEDAARAAWAAEAAARKWQGNHFRELLNQDGIDEEYETWVADVRPTFGQAKKES